MAQLLTFRASQRIIPGKEMRMRALQHVCLALPHTAQVRQLSCA